MQGSRSLRGDLMLANDNINQIRRLKGHFKRLAEDHNLVPTKIEEKTDQLNQTMATCGER